MPYRLVRCEKCGVERERNSNARKCNVKGCGGKLVAVGDGGVCPTCGRPLRAAGARRICVACKKPIGRGHKYHWVTVDGLSTIRHVNCAEPTEYRLSP